MESFGFEDERCSSDAVQRMAYRGDFEQVMKLPCARLACRNFEWSLTVGISSEKELRFGEFFFVSI